MQIVNTARVAKQRLSSGNSRRPSRAGPSSSDRARRLRSTGRAVGAGGRFIVRGEEAELTVFGSGVPVVSNERGKRVTR
jgi:hypothetical protein